MPSSCEFRWARVSQVLLKASPLTHCLPTRGTAQRTRALAYCVPVVLAQLTSGASAVSPPPEQPLGCPRCRHSKKGCSECSPAAPVRDAEPPRVDVLYLLARVGGGPRHHYRHPRRQRRHPMSRPRWEFPGPLAQTVPCPMHALLQSGEVETGVALERLRGCQPPEDALLEWLQSRRCVQHLALPTFSLGHAVPHRAAPTVAHTAPHARIAQQRHGRVVVAERARYAEQQPHACGRRGTLSTPRESSCRPQTIIAAARSRPALTPCPPAACLLAADHHQPGSSRSSGSLGHAGASKSTWRS